MELGELLVEIHLPSRIFLGQNMLLCLGKNMLSPRWPSKWVVIIAFTITGSNLMDLQLIPCRSFDQGNNLPPQNFNFKIFRELLLWRSFVIMENLHFLAQQTSSYACPSSTFPVSLIRNTYTQFHLQRKLVGQCLGLQR